MTSVIPQPWSNNSIQETGTYPRPDQGPNSFRHQPTNDHSAGHDYRHGHQAYDQQTYSSHSHEQFQSQQERLDLINKEYDQNYSHFYHIPHADSQEREAGDPALAPKSTLPLDQERQRSVTQAGGMNKRQIDTTVTDLPPSIAIPIGYKQRQQHQTGEFGYSLSDTRSESISVEPLWTADNNDTHDCLSEPVRYVPPASKKGLAIDRPYSFYKASPKAPQSVTKIDSPFGPPEPPVAATVNESQHTINSGSSTYLTHPSQSNPFVPPLKYQPSRFLQQYQFAAQTDSTEKERLYVEDHPPPPTTSKVSSTAGLNQAMATVQTSRERSNSDRYYQAAPLNPDNSSIPMSTQPTTLGRQPPIGKPLARSHSNGNGSLQSRQQYQQEQYQLQQENRERLQYGGNGYDQESTSQLNRQYSSGASEQPKRKGSGGNLLRKARQASDTALRGMGLSRKPSDKNKDPEQKAGQIRDASEQNSQIWAHQGVRPQPPSQQRGPHMESAFPNGQQNQDYGPSRIYGAELGRNKSMPDIKLSDSDQRTPVRGSSLTKSKTNHSRQRSQHQLPTAMSNEPHTAAVFSNAAPDIQDAYGGTTDDWRQAQQAEKEAREREGLNELSPKERSGHISLNSVSTLNLPPTTVAPTTSNLNRSTSRMLLPDRDRQRNQSGAGESSGLKDGEVELTQENTSLAKAAMQQGGILAQLQAATEAGKAIDPAATFLHQNEGRYIQRSNTAPYLARENRTILKEEELGSHLGGGSKAHAPLEHSKSEGHLWNNRQKRAQPQHQYLEPVAPLPDHQPRYALQEQYLHHHQQEYPNQNEPTHHPHPPASYQHSQSQLQQHQQQQRAIARARAMSNESAADTNKDLPPTPKRTIQEPSHDLPPVPNTQHTQPQSQAQRQPRLRSESQPESRHRRQGSGWQGTGAMTSDESVLALSRSLSPPPPPPPHKQLSHQRSGSFGQHLVKGAGNGQHGSATTGVQKERIQYGIDMLPLPVIPSPDGVVKKDANIGILPQDVLKTLDSETIHKIVTQAVIASRVYKALTLEEVDNLKKEQEDIQKYVDALNVSLAIETRMRDASHSLIRLHESGTNIEAVKASTGQLHATTRKMDQIVQKIQQSMERLLAIQRLLLQHESAVLNAGMRRLDGENRDLSRNIHELETVKNQEKEEKLKWKKEHTQLRIQSMIFPNPPGMEDYPGLMAGGALPNGLSASSLSATHLPMLQVEPTPPHSPRLTALEDYMKELNEEISKKDERISDLESQLRMVGVWADEFSGSLKTKFSNAAVSTEPKLHKQLVQLQERIEEGFRSLEANAHEMKIKAEEAETARNKALEFAATTLANTTAVTSRLARSSSTSSLGDSDGRYRSRQQEHQASSSPPRSRGPYNRSKTPLHDPHSTQNNYSDLNMVLNESLLELDHQISLDHQQQQSMFLDPKGRQPLSRENSTSRRAGSPVQRRSSRTKPRGGNHQQHSKDDYVIDDVHQEIKRLNAMVDELERLVKLKMQ